MLLETSRLLAMEDRLFVAELKAATRRGQGYPRQLRSRSLSYCWFMLRNAGAAQVVVCDSLIVALAHTTKLTEPELLRPWLYALAVTRRRPRKLGPWQTPRPRGQRSFAVPARSTVSWR